jgi:putative Mn2+ efflux pump MntP
MLGNIFLIYIGSISLYQFLKLDNDATKKNNQRKMSFAVLATILTILLWRVF